MRHARRARLLGCLLVMLALASGAAACGQGSPVVASPPTESPTFATPTIPVRPGDAGPPTRLPDPYGSEDLVAIILGSRHTESTWPDESGQAPSEASSYVMTTDPAGGDLDAVAARLASTLGFPGPASGHDGVRAYGDGHTHVLVVDEQPGLQWAYTRDGVRCTDVGPSDAGILSRCAPYMTEDAELDDPRSTQLSPEEARRTAAPVFEAVGLDVAAARVTPGWGTTLVSVAPTIEGLPTLGMDTGVVVDEQGVLSATGWLGSVSRSATYPVLPAAEAVRQRERLSGPDDCATEPTADASDECRPVALDPAELGLVRWTGHDEELMVPAWIAHSDDPPALRVVPAFDSDYLPAWMSPPQATLGDSG